MQGGGGGEEASLAFSEISDSLVVLLLYTCY
jgi:hypothetical protein